MSGSADERCYRIRCRTPLPELLALARNMAAPPLRRDSAGDGETLFLTTILPAMEAARCLGLAEILPPARPFGDVLVYSGCGVGARVFAQDPALRICDPEKTFIRLAIAN